MVRLLLIKFLIGLVQLQLFSQNLVLEKRLNADAIYLDHLNQIYLLNKKEHTISKYELKGKLLNQTSFKQGWDQAQLDVSDPFKIVMYYPGDFKIRLLDAQLSEIGSFDDTDLNEQAAVCYYTTDQIAVYSNSILKLKNFREATEILSARILQPDNLPVSGHPQLFQSNGFIYLFFPGVGISRFTQLLFEDKRWQLNSTQAAVVGDFLYYIDGNKLFQLEAISMAETLKYTFTENAGCFAVNTKFLVVLDGSYLKVIPL